MKHQKPATIVASLSTISSAIIITSNTHATGVTDQINVTISVACSPTSIVDTAHTATVENSAYENDIGETTFKVFCNDAEGFSVYAVGYTNDEPGNNTLKPTNLASSYAIASGGAAFALAGYFDNSIPNTFGRSGTYWSSTKNKSISTAERYSIRFNPNKVLTVCTGYGTNGYSARCVLKN